MTTSFFSADELKINMVYNQECMIGINGIKDNSIPLIPTNIPCNSVNKGGGGTMARFMEREKR